MAKIRRKVDFTGQKIWVGIDVHKKSWTVAVCIENVSCRPFSQAADAGQISAEHSQEKLGAAQTENQGNHPQDHAENGTGAWGAEPPHAGLGQLLQARHRVPEVQGFGHMGTLPAALLYLEAMETAKTQASGLPAIRRGSGLGQAVCLLPQGWLGNSL